MIANKTIKIARTEWDRCTRNGSVRIGNKTLLFHTFAPSLQNGQDVEIYLELLRINPSSLKNAKMMTYRIFDMHKTIVPLLEKVKSKQHTLFDKHQFQHEQDIVESTPMLIDPCMEYTWYTHHTEKLLQIPKLPRELRNLVTTLTSNNIQKQSKKIDKSEEFQRRKSAYEDFWYGLYENPTRLADVVTRMLELQHALGSDIGLPPVPPIHEPKIFDVVKQINRISQAVWAGENCATYLVLTPEIMYNEEQIDVILDYLKNTSSKFIVVKIKNLELDKSSRIRERDMFKKILKTINDIKKSKNDERVFVLLESGLQFYPAMAGGFDVVSTSLRALDKDGMFGRSINSGYGSWYDPKYLVVRSFQEVKKMLEIGNGLPCMCSACSAVKTIGNQNDWNKKRREHYIYSVSHLANEIDNFVARQRIELAVEKLSKSALANFKHMLSFQ